MPENFFEARSEASEVKARIVSKYFATWARVLMPSVAKYGNKISYIDLYAGPGRYKDGAASTPLLVLQAAIEDPKLCSMLHAFFNDSLDEHSMTLRSEIDKLPGIEKLKNRPVVTCGDVDDQAANYFKSKKLVPTFSFIDPFGYKGLSLDIIKGVIKDWGCDCVFFFNYSRINAGIGNPHVSEHMDNLFGKERADELRVKLVGLRPNLRESAILEALAQEIRSLGGKYVLPFTFRNEAGTRTTHKLVFVSKSFTGYDVMKGIMAGENSTEEEGVASLTYSPADASMPLLFSLNEPLSKMKLRLLSDYAGKSITRRNLYETDSIDTRFLEKNYTEVLKQLEAENKLSATSSKGPRRLGTFPDHVLVHFPEIL